MRRIAIFTAITLFILISNSLAENVTTCGYYENGNYILTNDIEVNGTCFELGSNTILDCDGHTITGNGTGDGIWAYQSSNITVRNCAISNFDNGAFFGSSNNLTVENLKIYNSNKGLTWYDISNSTIRNIEAENITGDGIFDDGSYNVIDNIKVRNATNGFFINHTANHNNVSNLLLYECGWCGFGSGGDSITPHDNNFINITSFNSGCGVWVSGDYDYYENITVFNNENGVMVRPEASYNRFKLVKTYNTGSGIHIDSSNNHYFEDIISFNVVKGIEIFYPDTGIVENITFKNIEVYNTAWDGISINNGKNISIENAIVYNSTNRFGISLGDSSKVFVRNATVFNHDSGIRTENTNQTSFVDITSYSNENGIFIWGGEDIEIRNSRIYNNVGGIHINNFAKNVLVENNSVYDNTKSGINLVKYVINITVRNNTILNNIDATVNSSQIVGNYIDTQTKDIWGIKMQGFDNLVENNTIYSSIGGIALWNLPSERVKVVNNSITSLRGIGIGGNDYEILNNSINVSYWGILFISPKNIIVSGNHIFNGKHEGCLEILPDVINNTSCGSPYGFYFLGGEENITITDNNISIDTLSIFETYYGVTSDVLACQNSVFFNKSFEVVEETSPVLLNVMRIESSQCVPYIDVGFYSTVDFGTVEHDNVYEAYPVLNVSSNMINITYKIRGDTDWVGDIQSFSVSNTNFTVDKNKPYPTEVVTLELNVFKAIYHFLINEFNNLLENMFRLFVPNVRAVTYRMNSTMIVEVG